MCNEDDAGVKVVARVKSPGRERCSQTLRDRRVVVSDKRVSGPVSEKAEVGECVCC